MTGQAGAGEPLEIHPNYRRLVALAEEGYARGRDPSAATPRDVALARLYAHAFRRHVIGAFHATREALGGVAVGAGAAPWVERARECLADLADRSMLAVERDERVLIATFRPYAVGVARVLAALDAAGRDGADAALATIRARFVAQMEAITAGNGLSPTRDTAAPPQGSFRVPALGIGIVPLVYGDDHSWNLAWLDGQRSDVPFHRHREGVEIHLGYSPLNGRTVLDDIDLVLGHRDASHDNAPLADFLATLDGARQRQDVLTIATTNDPQSLDPAAQRANRFDTIVSLPLPDAATRTRILERHLGPLGLPIDPADLAAELDGATGADVREVVRRAVLEHGATFSAAQLAEIVRSGRWRATVNRRKYL